MTKEKNDSMRAGKELALAIAEAAYNKKAENITLINPGTESDFTEWIVICDGTNIVHTKAIADSVKETLKHEHNTPHWKQEGYSEGNWILVDFSDVIVNIMLPDTRSYYNLEGIWKDAEPMPFEP